MIAVLQPRAGLCPYAFLDVQNVLVLCYQSRRLSLAQCHPISFGYTLNYTHEFYHDGSLVYVHLAVRTIFVVQNIYSGLVHWWVFARERNGSPSIISSSRSFIAEATVRFEKSNLGKVSRCFVVVLNLLQSNVFYSVGCQILARGTTQLLCCSLSAAMH